MSETDNTLFVTDADLSVQIYIYAQINWRGELVIEYRHDDDRAPHRNYTREAVVDREDTAAMAKRLNVRVEELPERLDEVCGVKYESVPSHADEVFQQALNFILDAGVRYRLKG